MKLAEFTKHIVIETNKIVEKINLLYSHKHINPKNKSKFKLLLSKAHLDPETATYVQLLNQLKIINGLFAECTENNFADKQATAPTKMSELFKQIFIQNNMIARNIESLYKSHMYCPFDTSSFDNLLSYAIINPEDKLYREICFQQKKINILFNKYVETNVPDIYLRSQMRAIDGVAPFDDIRTFVK